ncbi:helix-turn-helix domain-containing protein [Labilibacter sediminis]|nr:helix-turn-helix domain-containing protein [Labilibacter sediminis]
MKEIKLNRKIELNKQFKISKMKEVIKPTRPHKHDGYFEIIYLTDGAGTHTIDENEYSVEPPMLFSMSPGHVHCWEFSKIPNGYVCIFKEEFLIDYPDIRLRFAEFATRYSLIGSKESFAQEFELLFNEYSNNTPDLDILRSYLNIILLKVSRLPMTDKDKVKEANPTFVNFRKLVDLHYNEERNLDFYAEKLQVSKRVLNNTCQKEIGRSSSSLINERLIVESKRLLKHTTNSISQVAYHLNFNDPSHFVKYFKGKTNLTPGEFRAKL